MPAKKKKRILFIHSAGPQGPHQGSGDFIAYLKKVLGSGYAFKAPKMPKPEAPDYAPWKAAIAKALAALKGDVILIGHSLGGSVLVKYLSEERIGIRVAGLFLAAAPYWGEKGWEYDVFYLKEGFTERLPSIPRIFLYHSRRDPVVAFGHAERYAKLLPGAVIRPLKGDSHAFDKGGLPELPEDLRAL
jgi:predicted alpha/beta hydrolase family esterase